MSNITSDGRPAASGHAAESGPLGRDRRPSIGLRNPWVFAFGAVILVQIVALLAMPIVYETKHLGDTLFLLNEGWRVYLGLKPGVDFGSFYPGLAAHFIALSYALFGLSVRAVNIAPLLQLAVILPLAGVVLYRRCEAFSFMATMALIATCLLTRAPLEDQIALTDLASAHSFSYNRLGLACCLILALLVLLSPRAASRDEWLAGAAGGLALALALTSKWSFVLLVPAVLLALVLQRRHAAILGLVAVGVLGWMALDPLGRQLFGSAAYMQVVARAESMFGGLGGVVYKSLLMFLWHLWAFLILGITLVKATLTLPGRARWVWLASAVLVGGAIGGNLLVMGSFVIVGHQVLPVLAAMSIACLEQTRGRDTALRSLQRTLAAVLAAAFLLPHLTNSLLTTTAAFKNRNQVLIADGPMRDYLQRYDYGSLPPNREKILAEAAATVAQVGTIPSDMQYPVFVDGLSALQRLGDLSNIGIVSDGLVNFEFALGARPVVGFPLWPRLSSPEISGSDRIPNEADIVMVLRHGVGPFGEVLKERMGDQFRPCLSAAIWDVFVRQGTALSACS